MEVFLFIVELVYPEYPILLIQSASLVIAYLIRFHKMSFHSALKFTKNRRKVICPNLGFQLQLKKYDSHLHKTVKKNKDNNQSFPHIHEPKQKRNLEKLNIFNGFISTVHNRSPDLSPFDRERYMKRSGSIESKLQKEKYLKKIAQFRFGLTNTSKWGLN